VVVVEVGLVDVREVVVAAGNECDDSKRGDDSDLDDDLAHVHESDFHDDHVTLRRLVAADFG
jgi:hypothetical protein